MRLRYTALALCALLFLASKANAQINVTANQTAAQLVDKLVGTGVSAFNATLNCGSSSSGVFSATASTLNTYAMDSGIVLTTGNVITSGFSVGVNAAASQFASGQVGNGGDPNLNAIPPPATTTEGCYLQFDFIPAGDTIKFGYIFGSEEYPEFACSSFNDRFGFFIKPASSGTFTNIALIPGTSIPVSINTINQNANGCSNNAPGSGVYYVNNASSSTLVYDGLVIDPNNGTPQPMTAITSVIPCDTYTLKLAIADVGDTGYDSGVFLKAGSLNSVAINVAGNGFGQLAINDTAVAIRGCGPANFVISTPNALNDTLVIHYQISGTATNGVDYTPIADSVILLPGNTTIYVPIYAQHNSQVNEPIETVTICIETPYLCSSGQPSIVGCATIFILDTLPVQILTPDSSVCANECVPMSVSTVGNLDSFLAYFWTDVNGGTAGISDPTIKEPLLCPGVTTTYVLHSYIVGAPCDTTTDSITITVRQPADVDLGPDVTTCLGTPVQLNAVAQPPSQQYSYLWDPITNLSDPGIPNPIFTPTAVGTFTYVVTANPGAGAACLGTDMINITVLPDDFTLSNNDTTICFGASVQINATGDPAFSYNWTPTDGVVPPNIINPLITPADTGSYTYVISASYPGCPDIVKDITILVEPQPTVDLGPDRAKCQWDTLQLHALVTPAGYAGYTYAWTPDTNLNFGNITDVVFNGQDTATLAFTVRTPAGCSDQDQITITVYPGNFASLVPTGDTGVCPGDSLQLMASGGVFYDWSPGLYLSDSTSPSPFVHPATDVHYTGIVTDQYGCLDTLEISIDVRPGAVVELGDTILLYPGDSVLMNPLGNCLYFQWFPYGGLSNPNIANPVAMPAVDTRYYVTATTEWGCVARDSVVVKVAEDSELDVPNAFAPGSLGGNGEIKPVHLGLASIKYFRVYNRWGELVFSTTDINEGWDGSRGGTPQPMGVYVYQIEGQTFKGRVVKKSGNITLVR